MALELRQVVVPRVLAHLVERARDRAVVAAAALVALVQLPGVIAYCLNASSQILMSAKGKLTFSLSDFQSHSHSTLAFSLSVLKARFSILTFH